MQDNAKINSRNKKLYATGIVVVLIFVILFAGWKSGYRLKNNYTIGRVGTVSIQIPLPLTSVFIDESKKITTSKDNEAVKVTLSPRNHSVIVSHDGYFPWKKDFTVPSGKELTLTPIFVSQNATGEIITVKDPQYYTIRNLVAKDIPPSKDKPKISADKTTTLWLEDNAVMIRNIANGTSSPATIVLQPDTIVKNVEFYKDRSDVILFSTSNSIFAIEADAQGGQNFMPVYRGQSPSFVKVDANSIYVLDGENLMQVVI